MGPKLKNEKRQTVKTKPEKRFKCPNNTRRNKNGDCVDENGNIVVHSKDIPVANVMEDPPLPITAPNNTTRKVRVSNAKKGPDGEKTKSRKPKLTNAQIIQMNNTSVEPLLDQVPEIIAPELANMVEDDTCKTKKTGINAFLAEKERYEKEEYEKQPIRVDDPKYTLYPDLNDPAFSSQIAKRKEFQETKYDDEIYDIREQSDIMCDADFELLPHQLFVKNFLSVDTPYNSLLLYHGLGTGKTCTAIGVAEETRKHMSQMGVRDKILIVASPNVQVNFRKQLFDESKLKQIVSQTNPDEFTWNLETCVGNSLLKEIDPTGVRNVPRERIVSNIQTIINTWYEFMGYGQLANYITSQTKINNVAGYTIEERKTIELRKIRSTFNNRTIIIDEVHNINQTEENKHKTTGALLLRVAKYAVNMRLLLLSATPMFDTYKEIIWLVNLMNANDKRSQIDISEVFDPLGNIKRILPPPEKENKGCIVSKETGEELLIRKLTGYVSYVRGENPYTFPFRIYPDVFSPDKTFMTSPDGSDRKANGIPYPTVQMNDKPVVSPLSHIKVYLNQIEADSYQRKAYKYILDTIKRSAQINEDENRQFDMLQKPVECLNIVYPNEEFERILDIPSSELERVDGMITTVIGENGLNNIMVATEKGVEQSPKFEYKPRVVEKHGKIFSKEQLSKYSRKMANICDIVRQTEGIILIYSQYIDGGVVPMALALEEMGFAKYSSTGGHSTSLFRTPPTEPLDATTMLPRSQVPKNDFHQATYIMITGNKRYSPNNGAEISVATQSDNKDGSRVKVILISKAGSEGLDFKHIRQIHILEPWFNMNRIEQIIGRGVRNLSHCALPFEKRNVQIYLHGSLFEADNEEPVDLYIYRIAERKALQIGKVTRLLKTVSVDCVLNMGQLNMTAEKLMSKVENQRIEMRLATKQRVVLRVGDQPYTDICDYMDTCEYTCRNAVDMRNPPNKETIVTTYNTGYLESNQIAISKRIRDLFREQSAYKRDQFVSAINIRKKYPIEHIYHVLSIFIENPHEYLVDKYERTGYLVNNGEYYLFQPVEIGDTRASIFDRTVPVQYTRDSLSLELPKEVVQKERVPMVEPIPTTTLVEPIPAIDKATTPQGEESKQPTESVTYETILQEITALHNTAEQPPAQGVKAKLDKNWYTNIAYVRNILLNEYSITPERITKYVVYHALDTMVHANKLVLLRHFYGASTTQPKTVYETHVSEYIEERMVRNKALNKWGTLLVDKEEVLMYVRSIDNSSPEWVLADTSEFRYFKEDVAKRMIIDKSKLNQIMGYIVAFRTGEIVFKYKDITSARNKQGARCDSAGKADIIKLLNMVVVPGHAPYDDMNTKDVLFQPHLCAIMEIMLREYTRVNKNDRIYYLTPEQSVMNAITKFSTATKL
jgi:hypothetical protein